MTKKIPRKKWDRYEVDVKSRLVRLFYRGEEVEAYGLDVVIDLFMFHERDMQQVAEEGGM